MPERAVGPVVRGSPTPSWATGPGSRVNSSLSQQAAQEARGTVQARLDRLQRDGVLTSYRPHISPAAMGFAGLAYVRLHLAQGMLDETSRLLAEIPEVLEANAIAGEGDMLCRVVARDNADLEKVVQRILAVPGVIRSRTEVVLSRRIEPRITPLIEKLARET